MEATCLLTFHKHILFWPSEGERRDELFDKEDENELAMHKNAFGLIAVNISAICTSIDAHSMSLLCLFLLSLCLIDLRRLVKLDFCCSRGRVKCNKECNRKSEIGSRLLQTIDGALCKVQLSSSAFRGRSFKMQRPL